MEKTFFYFVSQNRLEKSKSNKSEIESPLGQNYSSYELTDEKTHSY